MSGKIISKSDEKVIGEVQITGYLEDKGMTPQPVRTERTSKPFRAEASSKPFRAEPNSRQVKLI